MKRTLFFAFGALWLTAALFASSASAKSSSSPSVAPDVVVHDLKLFVDQKEFFIKGMCYNPTPLGNTGDNNGGGLCSVKKTPFDDWRSACYDTDYWDGSSDPDRVPPGPDEWFRAIWERDFPLMQELGVNTIRVYSANPTTRQASIELDGTPPVLAPLGKDHIEFFDLAYQNGFKIIWPLIGDYTLLTTSPMSDIENWLQYQIDEVGYHPALLMFTFGNELPLSDQSPDLISTVNHGIDFARQYMQTKWKRSVPFISVVVDLPSSYQFLSTALDVDVFATNAGYRGLDFQDLWSGSATFPGWFNLSCATGKPVFIGEMGWLNLNNSVNEQIPNWFNQQFQALIQAIPYGCVGGAFFEYSDEIQKADPLQKELGVVALSAAYDKDGNSSLEPNVFLADVATRKPIIFDSLRNGSVANVSMMNMNMDVFSYLCREPATLDLTKNSSVCSNPFGYFTTYCTPKAEVRVSPSPLPSASPSSSSSSTHHSTTGSSSHPSSSPSGSSTDSPSGRDDGSHSSDASNFAVPIQILASIVGLFLFDMWMRE